MKELGNDNLEQIKQKGQKAWNQVLGKIEVEGGNLDQYRTFYSCLYRSLLFPRIFFELVEAGKPVHYSPYNGQVLPGYMFTDTGFWDTFRCLFPLLNLMYPSMNKEMQEGLINTYKEKHKYGLLITHALQELVNIIGFRIRIKIKDFCLDICI